MKQKFFMIKKKKKPKLNSKKKIYESKIAKKIYFLIHFIFPFFLFYFSFFPFSSKNGNGENLDNYLVLSFIKIGLVSLKYLYFIH